MLQQLFVLRSEDNAKRLYAFLKQNWRAMAEEGKPVAVTVTEYKAKRSAEQNRRYWAIVQQIAAESWVSGKQFAPEVWHEMFKREFIGVQELPNGQSVGLSTSPLSVQEFNEYMEKVERYAAEALGVAISDSP